MELEFLSRMSTWAAILLFLLLFAALIGAIRWINKKESPTRKSL